MLVKTLILCRHNGIDQTFGDLRQGHDFSALFTTVGPAITTLRPVLSVAGSYCAATDSDYKLAGVQPDDACFDCDGYETASEDGDSCGSYELADETV